MSTEDADLKAEMPELDLWWSGRKRRSHGIESASRVTVRTEPRNAAGRVTMEAVVSRENMLLALRAGKGPVPEFRKPQGHVGWA